MLDNGHLGRFMVQHALQRSALAALPGVIERIEVGGRGVHERLRPHPKACLVHHMKHYPHALVFLPE